MKHPFAKYHYTGLYKLLSFREQLVILSNQLHASAPENVLLNKKDVLIENFISTFCEHDLADTDYADVHIEVLKFGTLAEYIQHTTLSLPYIVKCLTYFIWTDRIVNGYLESRIKDKSLLYLLSQLNSTLLEASNSEQQVYTA